MVCINLIENSIIPSMNYILLKILLFNHYCNYSMVSCLKSMNKMSYYLKKKWWNELLYQTFKPQGWKGLFFPTNNCDIFIID